MQITQFILLHVALSIKSNMVLPGGIFLASSISLIKPLFMYSYDGWKILKVSLCVPEFHSSDYYRELREAPYTNDRQMQLSGCYDMHQILLHNYRMFPSKTSPFSQKLFVHCVSWTHNRITSRISAQFPASLFSNADYTSAIQKNKSLFWLSACHASGTSQQPRDHSSQLLLLSFPVFIFIHFQGITRLMHFLSIAELL